MTLDLGESYPTTTCVHAVNVHALQQPLEMQCEALILFDTQNWAI